MKDIISNIILVVSLSTCLILVASCKKEPCPTCPNNNSTVQLTIEDVSCREVWLKLKFADNNLPRGFALLRDGKQILSGALAAAEIILIDTNVFAGNDYNYLAQRLNGSQVEDVSSALLVRTLDSTSHAIQWQVDTLGSQGVIRDVWVFDRNNAWVVGEIYLNDITGKPNMANPYNVAHWDGSKWTLLQVQFYSFCGQTNTNAYPANAIWAFSPNDIMIASNAEVARMNGTTQIGTTCLPVSVNKIWGFKNNAVYTVGASGQISFWNGSTWTKMISNTTVNLQDIWGIDETHIWATGSNVNDGHSVILSFDGTNWNIIYDSQNVPAEQWYTYNSVWTDNSNLLYLSSGGLLRKLNLSSVTFTTINTGQTYISSHVRGIKQNDIFVTGQGDEVAHGNGASWHVYSEINFSKDAWWLTLFPTQNFVIVGGSYYFGYNSAPLVFRGYR
jgi:hypothetical protein